MINGVLRFTVLALLLTGLIYVIPTSAQEDENGEEQGAAPVGGYLQTLDDVFLEVSLAVPDFGGAYVDEDSDTLLIFLLNQDDSVKEAALSKLKEVFGPDRLSQQNVQILQGDYSFSQLKSWHDQLMGTVLIIPGIVSTDVDEMENRVHIGVENHELTTVVELELGVLNIPRDAVVIEVVEPVSPESSLQDYHRPLVNGLQIQYLGTCTLGFNAIRQGVAGFVTNSHCTNTQGGVEGTVYHQPTSNNKVGTESIDPAYFTGGNCPSGRRCRYSDSAFATRESGVSSNVGRIARPASNGTTSWNGVDTYRIVGEVSYPMGGEKLVKVGTKYGTNPGNRWSRRNDL